MGNNGNGDTHDLVETASRQREAMAGKMDTGSEMLDVILPAVRVNYSRDRRLTACAIVRMPGGAIAIIKMETNNQMDRQEAAEAIKDLLCKGGTEVAIVGEAWAVKGKAGKRMYAAQKRIDPTRLLQDLPSKYRREIAQVMYENVERDQRQFQAPILRKAGEPPEIGDWQEIESTAAGGRFASLFDQAEVE